jgi:hypothetical protein
MRRSFLSLAALMLLTAFPAATQSILPNSFDGWLLTSPRGTTLEMADAQFSASKEYGFVDGEEVSYRHDDDVIQVTLYKFKDASGAYGAYSYLRKPDMPRTDLADHSAISRERALILLGNLVLDVQGKDLPNRAAALKALIDAVKPHEQQGPLPTLWRHLPREGFVERSDHYFLGPIALNQFMPLSSGDWLGFSEGAEAELAKYRIQGREVTLLIADFPTPQSAAKKLAELQNIFDLNGSNPGISSPLFAKRSLTLLALVSGARSRSEAEILLKQIHSGTELTWNEPGFTLTEPNIGTMIVGTIIGTGIICAFTLISSLAFGGVRLVIKRLLPNRVFDRDSELQILQLGLTSKPINAEDFYGLGRQSEK